MGARADKRAAKQAAKYTLFKRQHDAAVEEEKRAKELAVEMERRREIVKGEEEKIRRQTLRIKALQDTRAYTGEYKTPKKGR